MKYRPIYIDERTGLAGFGPEAFQMIVEGYKCAKCWEEFPCYTPVCTVCGLARDLDADIQDLPQHWRPDPTETETVPMRRPRPLPKLDRATEAFLTERGWLDPKRAA